MSQPRCDGEQISSLINMGGETSKETNKKIIQFVGAVVVTTPFDISVEADGIFFKRKVTNRKWQIGKLWGWDWDGSSFMENIREGEWSISTSSFFVNAFTKRRVVFVKLFDYLSCLFTSM